jgi:MSHA pilin protein MshC
MRLLDRSLIDARGFSDQVAATLQYAQKAAVAQRRLVYVLIDTAAGRVRACLDAACTQPIASPAGGNLDVTAASSVVLASGIAQFSFDALGQPSFGATQSLTATGGGTTYTITIQSVTGYVQRS